MTLKTILSKPLLVLWYRLIQLLKIKYYNSTNFWSKLESKVELKVLNSETCTEKSDLFDKNFTNYNRSSKVLIEEITYKADTILSGTITVFEKPYQFSYPLNWSEDWRFNKKWESKNYKSYMFYEPDKTNNYDVKYPWELSRLSFLIPVARAYLLTEQIGYLNFINETLTHWKLKNPIAYTINWYPMEVSIRAINLIQVRELLILAPQTHKSITILNQVLLLQGVFLWRNIEYTDVRGNHYAANLAALHLLGKIFKDFYTEANTWYNYAVKHTENEFRLQFLDDGVNFEKSIPYHRLVLELFFVSFLAMKRDNLMLKPETLKTFKNAAKFCLHVTKPNLQLPIIGDNDSASIFQNDLDTLNNHSNLLQLLSCFLKDNGLNISDKIYSSTKEFFNVQDITNPVEENLSFQLNYFKNSGFISAKNNSNYFITNFGEIGMKGKGGHSHNDLFSFELMLNNQDIIVDPGCYTYTGNLNIKREMKSSFYHNGLVVNNEEIAPQIGEWGISNIAKPKDVVCKTKEDTFLISGSHNGYARLENPVKHKRNIIIAKDFSTFLCEDILYTNANCSTLRHLYFKPETQLIINNKKVMVSINTSNYLITFDANAEIIIKDYIFSPSYGTKLKSKCLLINNEVYSDSTLFFKIKSIHNK
jgi:hypothetical protein